jgi:hypothetical protein
MPEPTLQQKKEREADNAKERSTRRAVQTYTSAESHADGEALHLNRASSAPPRPAPAAALPPPPLSMHPYTITTAVRGHSQIAARAASWRSSRRRR